MTKKHRTVTQSSQSGKNATFGSLPCCHFPLHTVKNLQSTRVPVLKAPQHQATCSQTGKNATSRQLCRAVCSLYTLSKILNLLFTSPKNAATLSPMFAIRKTPHFQALGRVVVFFFSMHCQKLYLVLRSKNAAIYTTNSR